MWNFLWLPTSEQLNSNLDISIDIYEIVTLNEPYPEYSSTYDSIFYRDILKDVYMKCKLLFIIFCTFSQLQEVVFNLHIKISSCWTLKGFSDDDGGVGITWLFLVFCIEDKTELWFVWFVFVCHLVCVKISKSQQVYIMWVYSLGGVGGLNILALMKILYIISILHINLSYFFYYFLSKSPNFNFHLIITSH